MSENNFRRERETLKDRYFELFQAYSSVLQMYESRNKYPQFNIPMICIPATISNNVPGTEFSIGADTALNEIVKVRPTTTTSSLFFNRSFFNLSNRFVTRSNNQLKDPNDEFLLLKQWAVIVDI